MKDKLESQQPVFDKPISIDEENCYIIGNFALCPDKKIICRGGMFGTVAKDCFGYFPDSTLIYDEATLVILGGNVFFDKPEWGIDWKTVQLLSHDNYLSVFTDGDDIYEVTQESSLHKRGKYYKGLYPSKEQKNSKELTSQNRRLNENYYVKNGVLYSYDYPVFEQFDISKLRVLTSKSGEGTNFLTDDSRVIFSYHTGYTILRVKNKEHVTIEKNIIDNIDFESLQVLGIDILADKNAIYYRNGTIPINKLRGLKLILRELD